MDTRTLMRERLRKSRDWSAAIDELERELESDGTKSEQSERLYELAALTEDVIPERERCLSLYQKAWKLFPDNLKALTRAREVYGELGRFEMVAKLGDMELRSPMAQADLAAIVGEAMLDSGQKDRARQVLERAAERTPDSYRVKDALAALDYDPEFWEDEVERLTADSAKFDAPTAARMLLRAARILRLEAPDDPRLESTLKDVLAKDIDEPSANFIYETVLSQQTRWDELEAHHEERAKRADHLRRADRYRKFALEWVQRFKDKERGARFFTRSIEASGQNGQTTPRAVVAAFSLLRQVHGDRDEWKNVLDLADAVLDRLSGEDKLFVAVQAGLIAWKELKDNARAKGYFGKAQSVAPDHPDVLDFKQAVGLDEPMASGSLTGMAPVVVPAAAAPAPAPAAAPEALRSPHRRRRPHRPRRLRPSPRAPSASPPPPP
jgi:tetratricopeptide (TPR) repeat protein